MLTGNTHDDFLRLEKRIQKLERRKSLPFHSSHTWVIGGLITGDIYIPPAVFHVDYEDSGYAETQYIQFWYIACRTGSVSLTWSFNGAAPGAMVLPHKLAHLSRTRIRPVISSVAAGTEDLSIALSILHKPGVDE